MLPADALFRRTGATPLTRRSLFAGAGATATVLALAACDDAPTGTQETTVDGPAATLSEDGKSSGDAPVWQVTFDLDEDEDAPRRTPAPPRPPGTDRKSTRLNSSHVS